jgi:2-haloacid dehalogenase
MLPLINELAAREVPLFAITNFSGEFWTPFRAEQPIFDHFRDIVVSGAERLAKPDPAIYELALRRFSIPAEELIFVDDREENVAGAKAAGMCGHWFKGATGLREELADLALL